MAVHHRACRGNPYTVSGLYDLDPLGGGEFALRQNPADFVIEDFRRGTWKGVNSSFLSCDQELFDRQFSSCRPVDDLHRGIGMQVNVRCSRLDGPSQVKVRRSWKLRIDTTLHADFGCTNLPRLSSPLRDFVKRQAVCICVRPALRKRTEATTGVAHVRKVDVSVDDVRNFITDAITANIISYRTQRFECVTFGVHEH